ERFQLPGLDADRRQLFAADRDLQAIRSNLADFAGWDRTWPQRKRRLLSDERRSLFSAARVRAALR
ncbi:MAG TPA: hypothetical protein VJ859_16330, partial [Allosphingosinicella sp.]|nr:hypothetical protein [Allosphingosinicella sp.]